MVWNARAFAKRLNADLAMVNKRRIEANVAQVMNVIGDVKNRTCLVVDDIIDTAGTLVKNAEALLKAGATKVYASCTHPVLSGPAVERIQRLSNAKRFRCSVSASCWLKRSSRSTKRHR